MGALPPEFRKAVDVPAFEQVQAVRAAERAKIAEERQNDHDLGVAGKEADAGRVGTGTAEIRSQEKMAIEDEKERRNRTDTQVLLDMIRDIDRQIQDLQGLIDDIQDQIEDIQAKIDDLEDIRDRINDPDFDPDDPANADVMARAGQYGISADDIRNGTANDKIDDQIGGMRDAQSDHQRDIDDIRRRIDDLQRDRDRLTREVRNERAQENAHEVNAQETRINKFEANIGNDIEIDALSKEANLELDDWFEDDPWAADYESFADEVMPGETLEAEVTQPPSSPAQPTTDMTPDAGNNGQDVTLPKAPGM